MLSGTMMIIEITKSIANQQGVGGGLFTPDQSFISLTKKGLLTFYPYWYLLEPSLTQRGMCRARPGGVTLLAPARGIAAICVLSPLQETPAGNAPIAHPHVGER